MTWYNESMEIEVPKFTEYLKRLIENKLDLSKEAADIIDRISKGSNVIKNIDSEDKYKLCKAADLLKELGESLSTVQKKIQDIEVEITAVLETKLTDIGFIVSLSSGVNSAEVEIDARNIYFVPWHSLVKEKETITPEDLWFFGMARKVFPIHSNNIEFLKNL